MTLHTSTSGLRSRGTRRRWDVTYIGYVLGHGGDAVQMLTLARGAQQAGAAVNIIVPEVPTTEAFEERCRDEGVPCERTPLLTISMEGSRQSLRSIVSLFRSLDSSIVHYHTGNSYLPRTFMVAMAVLRLPRPFVTVQSPYETLTPGSLRAREWAFGASHLLESVVSPSEHGRRFQLRCGVDPERVVTIPNSFDPSLVQAGDGTVPRKQLGMGPTEPLVLFFSRLDAQKRPLDALHAFAQVSDRHPDARLVFAGIGTDRDALERASRQLGIAERVHLVGYQHNVADWLAAATVWILLTERENLSVAVLEALAAGCPVLSTRCPGNDEILDESNSITVDVGDVAGAANALDRLLSDASLRARLSDGGRTTANGYSPARMVQEYCRLYRRSRHVPDVFLE